MGLMDEVDPLVDEAYRFFEQQEAKKREAGHGEDELWHTSFHGSAFPGDNQYACGRHALYRMLDLPREPFSRQGRQFMDAGKDFENQVVMRFYLAGMLVSPPPLPGVKQLRFEDSEHWLSVSVDSIVVPPRSNIPYVIEIKNVYAKTLDGFRRLIMEAHPGYVRQTRCQIGMAHERTIEQPFVVKRCYNSGRLAITVDNKFLCPEHGSDKCLHEVTLEPVRHGWLYYASRDNPIDTRSFYFEYDKRFMDAGRRQLKMWQEWFSKGHLPQTHFEDKRFSHPFGWQWTKLEYPCKWCDYGAVCRTDTKKAIAAGKAIKLEDSDGVTEMTERYTGWSYEKIRAEVFQRWGITTDLQEAA